MTGLDFWLGTATGAAAAGGALVLAWWLLRRRSEATDGGAQGTSTDPSTNERRSAVDPGRSDGIRPPLNPVSPTAREPSRALAPASVPSDDRTIRLRLSQRILLHLARQGRLGPDDVAPREMSQAGMVVALEVGQGTLTGALRTLVEAGLLSEKREHARGVERRVKIYRLTSSGEALAKEIRLRRPTRPAAAPESMAVGHDAKPALVRPDR